MEGRLQSALAVLALTLVCWAHPTSCQAVQQTDLSSSDSVGFIEFRGSRLCVFELDGGVQVAEPSVWFSSSCSTLRYNRLYLRYQLSLPIQIDTDTLARPLGSGKRLGHVTVTRVDLQLDAALTSKDSKLTAVAKRGKPGSWKLEFLCDTFARCSGLKDELLSNPWSLGQAVQFSVIGRVGNTPVRFGAVSSANPLSLRDCHRGRWFVIQRRVDGNLSFKQNWDAYEKGFGNPKSNYWIGLESLFAITATMDAVTAWPSPETALCRMRMEAVGLNGQKYWSEYRRFQVMGPDKQYRLRIGDEVPGSTIYGFISLHNEQRFSTYDRDHDAVPKMSCSQAFGFGGFWWGLHCHHANPNGMITRDAEAPSAPFTFLSIVSTGKWIPLKQIVMMLKCA